MGRFRVARESTVKNKESQQNHCLVLIDGFQPFPGEWVKQKVPPVTVVVFFRKVHQHGCHVICSNFLVGLVENHLYRSSIQGKLWNSLRFGYTVAVFIFIIFCFIYRNILYGSLWISTLYSFQSQDKLANGYNQSGIGISQFLLDNLVINTQSFSERDDLNSSVFEFKKMADYLNQSDNSRKFFENGQNIKNVVNIMDNLLDLRNEYSWSSLRVCETSFIKWHHLKWCSVISQNWKVWVLDGHQGKPLKGFRLYGILN